MHRRIWTSAIIALLLLAFMPVDVPEPGFLHSTARAAEEAATVKQGLFYAKPNEETSTGEVVERADWMTLTRGHAKNYLPELRAAGYKGDVIEYLLGLEVEGPGPYANSLTLCDSSFEPANNSVAYNVGDFCNYIHPNESWFLHNGRGERLVYERPDGTWDYQMNPASEGWRAYFRERAVRDLLGDGQQAALGFDGIYFDNIPLRLNRHQNQLHNSDGTVLEYGDDAGYRDNVVSFLAFQRAALSAGGKLWANLVDFYEVSTEDYLRYTDQLDGYMSEAWGPGYLGKELDAEVEEQVLQIAEHTLKQGKELMALVQGRQDDYARQRYGLASYLLISDGDHAYFRFGYLGQSYGDWWDYSNYDVELGTPKGPRYQSGNLWRRDFACGYVTADLAAEQGEIVKTACPGDAAATTKIMLPGIVRTAK